MRKEYKTSTTLKRGQEYTFSVETSLSDAEVDVYIGLDYFIGRTAGQKITFEINRVVTSRDLIVDTGSGGDIVERVKLEVGSKATDWTRAPEDDREYIESQITITNEKITSEVEAVDGRISSISQEVGEVELRVGNKITGLGTRVTATENGLSSKVSGADFNGDNIASKIAQTPTAISLISRNIDLSGKVTFSSFDTQTKDSINSISDTASSASSTASNAWTRAGTAQSTAKTANSNATNAQSTASTARNTANSASSTASNAWRLANSADNVLSGWKYRNTTTIDGGKIYTGSINAVDIKAGMFTGHTIRGGSIGIGGSYNNFSVDSTGNMNGASGRFKVPASGDGVFNNYWGAARWKYTDAHYIYQDGSSVALYIGGLAYQFNRNTLQSTAGQLTLSTNSGNITLSPSNSQVYSWGNFRPYTNNSYWLGHTSRRWAGLYLSGGTVSESSDERLKENITSIPEGLVREFSKIEPKMYNTAGYTQFGYIAQDIERALFKYVTETEGIEEARRNKELFNMVSKDESYLALAYRQVSAVKDAEHEEKIRRLENRLEALENGTAK